ncbi:cytochrome C [Campylobacter fetus]|uniref:cytochrome C n=1 Tax=Campylobacter fetus TaxID=196 RepID=UPI003AF9DB4D
MRILIVVCLAFIMLYAKGPKGPEVRPVDNDLYKKECASCHFGYQPGLMSSKSWIWIMQNLENHYGSDANIDEQSSKDILAYLLSNASEKALMYKRSVKLTKSMQNGVLYKSITEIPYHIKKHKKLEKWMINQKEVKTLSNCSACHKYADKGMYGKKGIDIPNYGQWRE